MRFSSRRLVSLSLLAGIAVVWSGCSATKQSEYVAAVSTQVQVPRDLKAIRVTLSKGGITQFCQSYKVYDGKVQLPRSLGSFRAEGSSDPNPLVVTIAGFTEDLSDSSPNQAFTECELGSVGHDNMRILRRSRQPYIADKILFLPMPLKFSCYDKNCDADGSGEKTCKGGRCVDATIDPNLLPEFVQGMDDGTVATCFHANECVGAAVPAVPVNFDDCTFALPNSPSSPSHDDAFPPNPFPAGGDGINVEVTYDGGAGAEILDKDPDEGFTVPDPAKPQQFRLAPGLCAMFKGGLDADGQPVAHRITAVRASGLCRAKSPYQPLCADDQLAAMGADPGGTAAQPPSACTSLPLTPAPSVLMLLADDTQNHEAFFKKGATADEAVAAAETLNLPLQDPAFGNTKVGLSFFPGPGACALGQAPALEPKLARLAQNDISTQFDAAASALLPLGTPVDLDRALTDTYAFLGQDQFKSAYRRAVIVFGNRDFEKNACNPGVPDPPKVLAAAANAAAQKVQTYVLLLAKDHDPAAPPPEQSAGFGNELAIAGGTTQAYDGRSDRNQGVAAFQQIVKDIATCVYDIQPGQTLRDGAVLSYTDPISGITHTVTPSAAPCDSDATAMTGDGWGRDASNPSRIRICGQACNDYRAVLSGAQLYPAQYLQPSLAVPMFANQAKTPDADNPGPTPGPGADAACAPKIGLPGATTTPPAPPAP
jgi:hypothetical protein